MPAPTGGNREQILVRVSAETYSALLLAQPFVSKRSMQDLVVSILDEFLNELRARDQGFQQALLGLRQSQARNSGVLARRTATPGAKRKNIE